MMKLVLYKSFAALILMGTSLSAPAFAVPQSNFDRAVVHQKQAYSSPQPHHSMRAPIYVAAVNISASQAKSIALRHVPQSEFLGIKLVNGDVYRVRVMKNGHRIDVFVDANTGRIR